MAIEVAMDHRRSFARQAPPGLSVARDVARQTTRATTRRFPRNKFLHSPTGMYLRVPELGDRAARGDGAQGHRSEKSNASRR
jgi:hypothetical protein